MDLGKWETVVMGQMAHFLCAEREDNFENRKNRIKAAFKSNC